jgi:hypothetical protein
MRQALTIMNSEVRDEDQPEFRLGWLLSGRIIASLVFPTTGNCTGSKPSKISDIAEVIGNREAEIHRGSSPFSFPF